MKKITVIGAGISGLTSAYYLSKKGYKVTLLESSPQLGGLGTFFNYNDNWIDKFYHCVMPSDEPLLRLIENVGITDRLYWNPTRMGFIVDRKRYSFNTPMDLLKFKPLSIFQRFRFGVVSISLRFLGRGKDLDYLPIEKWFTKLYGSFIWNKILKQLFLSKFGDHSGNLPALYIWQRLGREKNVATRGYFNGGFKVFIDALEKGIINQGGEIRKNTQVKELQRTHNGVNITLDNEVLYSDWVISTIPLPKFADLIRRDEELKTQFNDPNLTYQGVVNALFFLNRPLDNFYWTPVVNSNTEFDGVVEMTELVKKEQYDNKNMVYVMKYCHRDSELFKEDERTIKARWKKQLLSLYPDLKISEQDIADVKLFKTPFVEPIYPLGYSKLKPNTEVGNSNILLATSAQVYPSITSWNSSAGLAEKVVEELENKIKSKLKKNNEK